MEPRLVVLDTSAVFTVLENEPEAPVVVEILDEAVQGDIAVLLPFLALMEVEYNLRRRLPDERAATTLALLEGWEVTTVESEVAWRHEAARIKAEGGLSLADAWIAALAILRDAELVHKDPEFDKIVGLKSVRL